MKQLLALLLLAPLLALAAGPTAVLSWTPSTTRADGSALTGAVTFNVYTGATGAEALTLSALVVNSVTLAGVSGQTLCVYVTEVDSAGNESSPSVQVCKTFAASPPNPPTGVTVK
jgi:hypothetical protein